MEIFLNLVWASLALASIGLWARFERRAGSERHLPMIALGLLLVILFPVISVSDDLWAIQNPAEADTCLRRNHDTVCLHSILPPPIASPEPLFGPAQSDSSQLFSLAKLPLPRHAAPALSPVENRPPPAA